MPLMHKDLMSVFHYYNFLSMISKRPLTCNHKFVTGKPLAQMLYSKTAFE